MFRRSVIRDSMYNSYHRDAVIEAQTYALVG